MMRSYHPMLRERRMMAWSGLAVLYAFLFTFWAQNMSGVSPNDYKRWILNHDTLECAYGPAFVLAGCLTWRLSRSYRRPTDPFIFPASLLLSGLGLATLYRLHDQVAEFRDKDGLERLFHYQFCWTLAGLALYLAVTHAINKKMLQRLENKKYIFAVLAILLIVLTILFGVERSGRRLWLNLVWIEFMPIEFVKILAVFFAAGYFGQQGVALTCMGSRLSKFPYFIMAILTILPVFFQKDIGPTVMLFGLFAAAYGAATNKWIHVAGAFICICALMAMAYFCETPSIVRVRIDMWLYPFMYGETSTRALWAIASGGWTGAGWTHGISYQIPVVWSDFNFVVIAEELGWWGAVLVICIYGILISRCLAIAVRTISPYQRLLAVGFASALFIQTLMIIGGDIGLLPLTGITLPFVSYGGSSILAQYLMLGILTKIASSEQGVAA